MSQEVVDSYLIQLHQQREQTYATLEGLTEAQIWQRPAPGEWSIGEILDHLRVLNRSLVRLMRPTWWLLRPLGRRRRHKPYEVTIDDVYRRQGFPMNVGWLWPPRYGPERPVSAETLRESLRLAHDEIGRFFRGKDPATLGHVSVYDPLVGWMSFIQVLRIGLYHDELHFEDVRSLADRLKQEAPAKAGT